MKSKKQIRRQNLAILIKEAGGRSQFTDSDLATRLKVSYSYVGQLINGSRGIGESVREKLEQIGGKAMYWLDSDHDQVSETLGQYQLANIKEGSEEATLPALISWVQAGNFCDTMGGFDDSDAEKWLPCPVKHSEKTYILRVQGESMSPEYRDGDLIFVDPLVRPEHNSDIVVLLENDSAATFKRLQIVGGKKYIAPINKDWPEHVINIDQQAQICGVVIFSGRER